MFHLPSKQSNDTHVMSHLINYALLFALENKKKKKKMKMSAECAEGLKG